MEETTELKTPSLTKGGMHYGAILGLLLVGISLLFYLLGIGESSLQQYMYYGAIIGLIIFGVRKFRDAEDGFISYGRALALGSCIGFFGSVIIAFFTYALLSFVDAGFITKFLEAAEKSLIERKMSDQDILVAMAFLKRIATPIGFAVVTIFFYSITGFFFSLIIAIFMKREGGTN